MSFFFFFFFQRKRKRYVVSTDICCRPHSWLTSAFQRGWNSSSAWSVRYFKSSFVRWKSTGCWDVSTDARSLRDVRNNGGDVVGRRATFAHVYLTNKPRCVYRARELPKSLMVHHIARTYLPATMPRAIHRAGAVIDPSWILSWFSWSKLGRESKSFITFFPLCYPCRIIVRCKNELKFYQFRMRLSQSLFIAYFEIQQLFELVYWCLGFRKMFVASTFSFFFFFFFWIQQYNSFHASHGISFKGRARSP